MKYKFSDLFDIDRLQALMEKFTEATEGTAVGILDLEGKIMVATGWKDICTKFHRVHPQTLKRCVESDTALASRLKKGEKFNVYKCLNGLVDVAVPILVQGEHVGNFAIGQFLFEPPDEEFFRNQAVTYGFDEASYLEAVSEVKIIPEDRIRKTISFQVGLVEFIGEMGLTQKRQLEVNEQLQRLDRLKDEFLANTSHELRTPLTGIIGIADSLMDGAVGPLTEEQRYNLSLIVSSGRRLTNLVNDVLDFSKLRHKDLQLRIKPVDMRTITDIVIRMSQPLLGNKKIELVNRIGPDTPAVAADEDRLQQIMYNLIGNAVKFTEEGSVSVSARTENGSLAIKVSDTGIGIPEDKLDRIFVAFEQADGTTARKYGGAGLGLAVTKNLVELHGGEIRAVSEFGKGSDFTFTIPVSPDKAEPMIGTTAQVAGIWGKTEDTEYAEPLEEPAEKSADLPLKHTCDGEMCRVLVVDDEPVNLQVLKNQLVSESYSVTLAADGKEAISAIKSGQDFDIVLLDIMMPGMSGYEVCQHLREKYPANELPVVMLTAKNQVQDLVAGFGAGASDFLTKPFSKEELISRIDTHVSLKYLYQSRLKTEMATKLLEQEMELAQKIQTALVPRRPEISGYEIAAVMEPAEKVGGDYYDVISVGGFDWIVIGDVSGHGVPAGLVMMMVQTSIHTVLNENPEVSPSALLSVINKVICDNIQRMGESKHMTIIVLAAGKHGNFSFSGLHEDILIWRSDTGKVEKVESGGMWIGLEPDISAFLSDDTLQLNSGDCMVLFTDGITESKCEKGEMFGDERLIKIIEKVGNKSASEILDSVTEALDACEIHDDVTLLVIRRI